MTISLPDILPRKVSLPVELHSTPAEDYASLLVRLRECERSLAEERAQAQDREDQVWVTVVSALYAAQQAARDPRRSLDERLVDLTTSIQRMWTEAGLELIDPVGQRLSDCAALDLEVLCTRPSPTPEAAGLIAETWRPTLRRTGRVLQRAQVVVLSSSQSEEQSS